MDESGQIRNTICDCNFVFVCFQITNCYEIYYGYERPERTERMERLERPERMERMLNVM